MPRFKFENGQWSVWNGSTYLPVGETIARRLEGYTSFGGPIPGTFKGVGKPDLLATSLFEAQFDDVGQTELVPGADRTAPTEAPKRFVTIGGKWQEWNPAIEQYEVLDEFVQAQLVGYDKVREEGDDFTFTGPGKIPISGTVVKNRAVRAQEDAAAAATTTGGATSTWTRVISPEGEPTNFIENTLTGERLNVPLTAETEGNAGQVIDLGSLGSLVGLGGGRFQLVSREQEAEEDQRSLSEQMAAAFEEGDFDKAREIRDFLNQPQNLQEAVIRALTNPDLTPEEQRAEAQRLFNFANQPTVIETTKLLLEIAQSPADIFALSALMGGAQLDQGFVGGLPRMPELEATARALLGDAWQDFVNAGINTGGLDQVDDSTMEAVQTTETLPEQEVREQEEIAQADDQVGAPDRTGGAATSTQTSGRLPASPFDPEPEPGPARPSTAFGEQGIVPQGGNSVGALDRTGGAATSTQSQKALANPFDKEIDDAMDEAQALVRIVSRKRKVAEGV